MDNKRIEANRISENPRDSMSCPNAKSPIGELIPSQKIGDITATNIAATPGNK